MPRTPKPAGDHDAVEVAETALGEQTLDILGLDPVDLHVGPVMEAAVLERLDHREVGVGQIDVLADEADPHRPHRCLDAVDEGLPRRQVDLVLVEAEQPAEVVVEALCVQHERDLVEVAGVGGVHDGLDGNVTEVRDLALERVGHGALAAAHDRVGLDAPAAQLGDRVLRRLGLLLA